MKTKKTYLLIYFFGILLIPKWVIAQDKKPEVQITDELGVVTDRFQDYFFEALKQKAIENYDRALKSLEKAAQESPDEMVIYFEMAKNYGFLKQWDKAEENYQKALQMEPGKPEIYEGLYDVYYNTSNYLKAIDVVKNLIPFDNQYKEDLANLYERTEQYDKALQLLDQLDQEQGNNEYRNQLRQQIYSKSDDTGSQISDLEQRIKRRPVNEQDFLNLIYLYSEQNNKEAAFATAKKLIEVKPDSDLAHLALYKFYLDDKKTAEAITSMKKIFASNQIDSESKYKVLNDFLSFASDNPNYEQELEGIVTVLSNNASSEGLYEILAVYFLNKKQEEKSLLYFEKALTNNPNNFNALKNILLLQIDFQKYQEAEKLSKQSLDLYPAQPLLYLLNGVANLKLNETQKAKTALETGLEYLIDDPIMQRDFYLQLSKVFKAQGNTQEASKYLKLAEQQLQN